MTSKDYQQLLANLQAGSKTAEETFDSETPITMPVSQFHITVLRRDECACQNCGSTLHLDVAHILSRAQRPDLATDPRNAVTLCRKCHLWFHAHRHDFDLFCEGHRMEIPPIDDGP